MAAVWGTSSGRAAHGPWPPPQGWPAPRAATRHGASGATGPGLAQAVASAHRTAGRRAGDADRRRGEQILRRAYADGRLDLDELDRRLDRVAEARTRAEVVLALRGLPGALWGTGVPAGQAARRLALRVEAAALRAHAGAFAALNGTTLGVWGLTGADGVWPLLVALPTAALLGGHAGVSPSRRDRQRRRRERARVD